MLKEIRDKLLKGIWSTRFAIIGFFILKQVVSSLKNMAPKSGKLANFYQSL